MKIVYLKQDITEISGSRAIPVNLLHGVNCQRAMGSGAAKAMYTKWPVVRESYMAKPQEAMRLGENQYVGVEPYTTVTNCFTQMYYGYDGKKYADLEAIKACIEKASLYPEKLYMVKIGSDFGGLDWEGEIVPMIEELHSDKVMTVCYL